MLKHAKLVVLLLLALILWGWAVPLAGAAEQPNPAGLARQDLSQRNPQADGVVALNGPWAFYWSRLLEPQDFTVGTGNGSEAPKEALIVQIPAQWRDYSIGGQALSNVGYGTYRMTFGLSAEAARQPLGLYVRNVATSYRLWINGEPAGGIGTVGMDAAQSTPRNHPKVYYFQPRPGTNELLIQVSNFAQRTGGLWEAIDLGDADRIASRHRDRVMLWSLLSGCLLVMTVFSLFLYFLRKQELAALWFGVICLAICTRSALLGESYVYVLFPSLSWEWGVKLEYLSEIVTILGLAIFVTKQYPHETIRRVLPVLTAGLAGFGALVLLTPARVYTQLMVPYILVLLLPGFLYVMSVYIRAAIRHRTGSRSNMIGFTGFFAAVLHEILYYTGFVPFGGLVSFGLLFFLLTQLLNLSLLFTRAVTRTEVLSVELNQVIASQEETIRQRTSSLQELNLQLEQANRELNRIEAVRSSMLADVYHDLSTPITAIKGIAKAIKTAVIPADEAPPYAGRIYERSLLLEKLIDNVIELSQLKTGEVQFQFVQLPILPFLRELHRRYAAEALEKGVRLEWEKPELPLQPGHEPFVSVDRFRLERVFANLISNAVKFSPEGGVVRIRTELQLPPDSAQGKVILHVTDTGPGIPETELEHIFKRRYRVPGQAQAGSGLGLAICTEIVTRHQGEIGVSSKPGEGSDFFIALPARIEATEGGAPYDDELAAD